jgi:hypothetical protein
MLYDEINEILITLEKAVNDSCYLQTMEIIGTSLKKQQIKKISNENINPIKIAYNENIDSYVLYYNVNNLQYIQHFDFTDDKIKLGLRYCLNNLNNLNNLNSTKLEQLIYPSINSNYLFNVDNVIYEFIDNYPVNPLGYLGMAVNNANKEEICQVTIKGHIHKLNNPLSNNYLGKKIYLQDPSKQFPNSISLFSNNGIFIGTVINKNSILIGL